MPRKLTLKRTARRKPRKVFHKKRLFSRRRMASAPIRASAKVPQTQRFLTSQKRFTSSIPRWLTFGGEIPPRLRMSFRYNEGPINRSSVAVDSDLYAFRLNSIYDPNYTGTGYQPALHDAMATLYTLYKVQSARIQFKLVNHDSDGAFVALLPYIGVGLPTMSIQKLRRSAPVCTHVGANGTDSTNASLTLKVVPRKFVGRRYDEATWGATFNANPTEAISVGVYVHNDRENTTYDYTFEVVIDYDCILYDPIVDRATD